MNKSILLSVLFMSFTIIACASKHPHKRVQPPQQKDDRNIIEKGVDKVKEVVTGKKPEEERIEYAKSPYAFVYSPVMAKAHDLAIELRTNRSVDLDKAYAEFEEELVLMNESEINARNTEGKTLGHYFIQIPDERFIRLWLDRGGNLDIQDNEGRTIPQLAAPCLSLKNIAAIIDRDPRSSKRVLDELDAIIHRMVTQRIARDEHGHTVSDFRHVKIEVEKIKPMKDEQFVMHH